MIGIVCVLVESTLTPLQGFLNFFLNLFGLDGVSFVSDILGFLGCS
ncbi:MAG TPA: hypothetical protein P5081_19185 [Phycisphaerae bacterium]|nr:hypothetical protein [Phycisphaerae bacterium]HRW54999.1 hypothetical protein [Phycisphaerae bacterium]